jgi:hypothetical protein
MTRLMFTIAVAFLCGAAAARSPPVTFESPCECRDAHGKGRFEVQRLVTFHSYDARVPAKTGFHDSAFIGFLPTAKLKPD